MSPVLSPLYIWPVCQDATAAQSLTAPPAPQQLLSGAAGTSAVSKSAAGASIAGASGSIALVDEAGVIKIDDEEEVQLQPDTSMDALLAQQLASELEQGSYAQVLDWHPSPAFTEMPWMCLHPAGFQSLVSGRRTC